MINVMIETIVKIETRAYKIVRVECSMLAQSGITRDEKRKLLHRNFIYYRTVSYDKHWACHTHQVNNILYYSSATDYIQEMHN